MNRLAREASPYLRQHAGNPVDWYPWGEEAFEAARAADRPILLSIGYSSCHWCHVMAHESFEDPDTAAVVNELFVSVKVDREERPDVDAVYMEAVQALTGAGGWPLTAFITPDGRPFFAGTYFPPEPARGQPSFLEVCRAVHEAWTERRDELMEQADAITAHLSSSSPELAAGSAEASTLAAARDALVARHDAVHGGFGDAPKFPQSDSLDLLLRLHARSLPTGDADAVAVVVSSLDAMAAGGIRDHLGGGFARYSVDRRWLVPHFEKMLYDQALLAKVYLHAWQVTGEPRFRAVLDSTLGYVVDDLRHPSGGFFAAEDADSEGREGLFYLWTPRQVRDVVGPSADEAIEWWGVTEEGHFEGAAILNRLHAERPHEPEPDAVVEARRMLLAARARRVRPGLDDKVLTEWNGLMVATLAEAGAATGDGRWTTAAVGAAEHLLLRHRRDDGRWMRSWQDDGSGGRARHLALAADVAALVDAFTRIAEATGHARWIAEARSAADQLLELFWDHEGAGLFTTGHDGERLVTRAKDLVDGATPSANSTAALALLRLAALTGHQPYRHRGEEIVSMLAGVAGAHPTALASLLAAADLVVNGIEEVAVVGDAPELVREVQRRYLPGAVLAWGEPYESPLWEGRSPGHAYVCRDFTCRRPVTTPAELAAQLTS